jgi:hypothetical protein
MGLMFSGYIIATSFALEMMFGIKDVSNFIGKVSVVEIILFMLAFCGYFAFIIIKPNFFGEFTDEFKNDKVSPKFYNAMILERLVTGTGLVFLLNFDAEGALLMVIFIIAVVFIAVKRPYR